MPKVEKPLVFTPHGDRQQKKIDVAKASRSSSIMPKRRGMQLTPRQPKIQAAWPENPALTPQQQDLLQKSKYKDYADLEKETDPKKKPWKGSKIRPAQKGDMICPVHKLEVVKRHKLMLNLPPGQAELLFGGVYYGCPKYSECGWFVTSKLNVPTKYDTLNTDPNVTNQVGKNVKSFTNWQTKEVPKQRAQMQKFAKWENEPDEESEEEKHKKFKQQFLAKRFGSLESVQVFAPSLLEAFNVGGNTNLSIDDLYQIEPLAASDFEEDVGSPAGYKFDGGETNGWIAKKGSTPSYVWVGPKDDGSEDITWTSLDDVNDIDDENIAKRFDDVI